MPVVPKSQRVDLLPGAQHRSASLTVIGAALLAHRDRKLTMPAVELVSGAEASTDIKRAGRVRSWHQARTSEKKSTSGTRSRLPGLTIRST